MEFVWKPSDSCEFSLCISIFLTYFIFNYIGDHGNLNPDNLHNDDQDLDDIKHDDLSFVGVDCGDFDPGDLKSGNYDNGEKEEVLFIIIYISKNFFPS